MHLSRPPGHVAIAIAFIAGLGLATAYHRLRLGETPESPPTDAGGDPPTAAENEPARRNAASDTPPIRGDSTQASGAAGALSGAPPRGRTAAIGDAAPAQSRDERGAQRRRTAGFGAANRAASAAESELGRLYGRVAETSLFLPSCWSADVSNVHVAALQRAGTGSEDSDLVIVSDPTTLAGGRTSRVWQTIIPERFRGERIAVRSQLRSSSVENRAFMWVTAADANGNSLAYDGMDYSFFPGGDGEAHLIPGSRALSGDRDWDNHEIVLEVPVATYSLSYGFTLVGDGALWADDLSIAVVDATVPVTAGPDVSRAPVLALPIAELTLRAPFNTDFQAGGFLDATTCIERAASTR